MNHIRHDHCLNTALISPYGAGDGFFHGPKICVKDFGLVPVTAPDTKTQFRKGNTMKTFESDTTTCTRRAPTPCQPAPEIFTGIEPCSLVHAVQAAVRAVDAGSLRPVAGPDAGPLCQPTMLLALLSYNYARQIYSSVEIECAVRSDAELRQICPRQLPDVRILLRFRRENREALHLCLKVTLRQLAESKVAAGFVTRVSDACLAEEANRRIIMAMFTDSTETTNDRSTEPPVDLCYLFAKERMGRH